MSQKEEEVQQVKLPFSEAMQLAMLGWLMTDDRFFMQCRDIVKPEWFLDLIAGKVYAAKLKLYKRLDRIPTRAEVEELEFTSEDNKTRAQMLVKLNTGVVKRADFGLDVLSVQLTQWLHCQMYRDAVQKSAHLYNQKKFDQAFGILDNAAAKIKTTRFDEDGEIHFDKPEEMFASRAVNRTNACTFGLTLMDQLLIQDDNPETCRMGSLLSGDSTVLLAPTNIGKTTTMINVAIANVLQGKHVLLLTHEGRPEDIQDKIWCNLLGCTRAQLFNHWQQNPKEWYLRMAALKRFFTYIPMNDAGMNVEKVESAIRRRQENRMHQRGGSRGYDLVLDDYPAKLGTIQGSQGNLQYRHVLDIVYNRFVQLALEYNYHSVVAFQTNRNGSAINRNIHTEEKRLLTMEDAAEAWGPMTTATNVISINRDERLMALRKIIFSICKSRSSEVGWAVACNTDFARAITHRDSLGAIYYRGSSTMGDKIESLMEQYLDKEVPMEKVREYA
jgi:hypothetical protein